jgi:hypothetical protein
MRRLEGVVEIWWERADSLKQYSLLFDSLYLTRNSMPIWPSAPDFEYLRKVGFVKDIEAHLTREDRLRPWTGTVDPELNAAKDWVDEQANLAFSGRSITPEALSDFELRLWSTKISQERSAADVVPICEASIPDQYLKGINQKGNVLEVAMKHFPIPGPMNSWQDILDFKSEMHDKQWHFRRFLSTLAGKNQAEAEIRDDLEWTLNEYRRAMKIHRLKAGDTFMEVYVIPVIELVEDLAKFNWSKITKGALGVQKRQVELMEAEMKAPGRECAYVFEAQKRFGHPE